MCYAFFTFRFIESLLLLKKISMFWYWGFCFRFWVLMGWVFFYFLYLLFCSLNFFFRLHLVAKKTWEKKRNKKFIPLLYPVSLLRKHWKIYKIWTLLPIFSLRLCGCSDYGEGRWLDQQISSRINMTRACKICEQDTKFCQQNLVRVLNVDNIIVFLWEHEK